MLGGKDNYIQKDFLRGDEINKNLDFNRTLQESFEIAVRQGITILDAMEAHVSSEFNSSSTSSIFPKKDLGEKKEALIQIISTHMPPSKVKIRF